MERHNSQGKPDYTASVLSALQTATHRMTSSDSNFGSESSHWSLASIDSFRFPSSELSDGGNTCITEPTARSRLPDTETNTQQQDFSPRARKSKSICLRASPPCNANQRSSEVDDDSSSPTTSHLSPNNANHRVPTSPQVYQMAASRTYQAQLGFEFRYGRNSKGSQNLTRAYRYYEEAATAGCADSVVANTVAHIFGIGVSPQLDKACDMLRQAMLQGSVEALEIRALCWMDGTFGERSYASCLNLLAMGIARNSAACLLWSGFCFEIGLGMEPDADTAKQAYLAAADSPSLRSIVKSSFPGALSTGDPWMLLKVTLFLLHTDARVPNRAHVMDCLKKAAILGLQDAQVYLAICLIRGTWLKRDPIVAQNWLKKACGGPAPHPVARRLLAGTN